MRDPDASCWAIIPAKHPAEGKSRLAGVLDDAARARLVALMLAHVIETAQAAAGIGRVAVVCPPGMALPPGVLRIDDPGAGHNSALTHAFAAAAEAGATRVVVLAGDLPRLAPRDVELLAAMPAATLAIAPDRHESGTNALSLPLPEARGFTFGFGTGSFARHDAESVRLRLDCEVIHSPGLARDIDEPEDLRDARALLPG